MTTHAIIYHAGPDAIGTVTECADEQLADTQRAIIEAAERRGYERGLKDAQHAPAPYARVLAQAEADSDALRADAERYRWLRRKVSAHGIIDGWTFSFPTHLTLPAPASAMRDPAGALDAAIDAEAKR